MTKTKKHKKATKNTILSLTVNVKVAKNSDIPTLQDIKDLFGSAIEMDWSSNSAGDLVSDRILKLGRVVWNNTDDQKTKNHKKSAPKHKAKPAAKNHKVVKSSSKLKRATSSKQISSEPAFVTSRPTFNTLDTLISDDV